MLHWYKESDLWRSQQPWNCVSKLDSTWCFSVSSGCPWDFTLWRLGRYWHHLGILSISICGTIGTQLPVKVISSWGRGFRTPLRPWSPSTQTGILFGSTPFVCVNVMTVYRLISFFPELPPGGNRSPQPVTCGSGRDRSSAAPGTEALPDRG